MVAELRRRDSRSTSCHRILRDDEVGGLRHGVQRLVLESGVAGVLWEKIQEYNFKKNIRVWEQPPDMS